MKLQQKIILVSLGLAVAGALICALAFGVRRPGEFVFYFGAVAFWGGLLELFVGLILLAANDKRISQGTLMASGILILVGFLSCTGSSGFT